MPWGRREIGIPNIQFWQKHSLKIQLRFSKTFHLRVGVGPLRKVRKGYTLRPPPILKLQLRFSKAFHLGGRGWSLEEGEEWKVLVLCLPCWRQSCHHCLHVLQKKKNSRPIRRFDFIGPMTNSISLSVLTSVMSALFLWRRKLLTKEKFWFYWIDEFYQSPHADVSIVLVKKKKNLPTK